MHYALIRMIILIGKQRLPAFWEVALFHCKSVVLSRNVAALGTCVRTWLVVAAVAVPANNEKNN